MKKILLALTLALTTLSVAHAREEKAPTPQQERMRHCNEEAGKQGLKGDERKSFMSQCLKGGSQPAAARTEQQQRMADCNREAKEKGLKGEERKKFMSQCLKKK
ncbi:PsiF family protein [Thiobacter aerophilum]|uniref:PsiF family protein n=1 Tax=Thiobacter aerophilum TaxID=3121275 RepID=A0ABV0EGD9_9BURK